MEEGDEEQTQVQSQEEMDKEDKGKESEEALKEMKVEDKTK